MSVGEPADRAGRSDEVAILAPSGRDGRLAQQVLGKWGVRAVAHPDMEALCGALRGGVGAVVLAEEALRRQARERLVGELAAQPEWSDVPLVLLTAAGELSSMIAEGSVALARRGNVTLLERPVRIATLATAVRSALRARERQYDLRDYLAELRAAREAAEAANRAKSEFLAVMSHELRTPLNAIGGYAELMEMGIHGPVTPEQRTALERIQKSQRALLSVINEVLNYARLETGAVAYDLANVPVVEAVGAAEVLIAPQLRAKGLSYASVRCEPGLAVRADREKLQQILLNLLSNAVKFTNAREGLPGRVEVHCEADAAGEAAEGGRVLIRVRDTGIGIPADQLERIFEPFVQVDARLTRPHEGTGLGLAISRDLARGMGGDLSVESTPGAGSTFTLTLPRAP